MKTFIRNGFGSTAILAVAFAFAIGFAMPAFAQLEGDWDASDINNYSWEGQNSGHVEVGPQPTETYQTVTSPTETYQTVTSPTISYDVYNVYDGYPYSYGGCGYGYGCGGSAFNFGLFYSNFNTPSFVNPVVYNTPISYNYPVYPPIITQPSITNVNAPTNTCTASYTCNTTIDDHSIYNNYPTPITYSTPVVYSTPITYSTPVVYSTPITYSTPTYYTQPSVSYVTPVNYTAPQYNVQAYVPPTYNYGTPSCSITASNSYGNNYNYGVGQMALSWYSNNANSGYITPSVGTVSTSGSTTVYPSGGQVYVLTVNGPGGSATCQTYAYANNYVAPAPTTPATPYVALTQIPYTGLDLGPVGNALYWLSLALFAIAGAYLVVYYNGGAMRFLNDFLGADGPTGPWSAGRATKSADSPVDGPVPVRSAPRAERVIEKAEPVASVSRSRAPFGTKDMMTTVKPTNGDAPRIVIVRA